MFKIGGDGIVVSRSIILERPITGSQILAAVNSFVDNRLVVEPAELNCLHIGATSSFRTDEWIIGGIWGLGHNVTYSISLKDFYRVLIISHCNWEGTMHFGITVPDPEACAAQAMAEVRMQLTKALAAK